MIIARKPASEPSGRRFAVALSFPGELESKASAIAHRLADAIGQHRVFYYRFYEAELAHPNLDLTLLEIYRKQSDLLVVFLSRDYEAKKWCGLEWRAVRDLITSGKSEQIMLLRFDDTELAGLLSIDGYIDARVRTPRELAGLILDRLQERPHEVVLASQEVERPGMIRHLLDRALPGLHLWLTRVGTFPEPPEMADLHAFLGELKAGIENDVREKTYLPLEARDVPRRTAPEVEGGDPFARPVQQHIRQVLGIAEGGDSASAQIAAVNRRSRLVKDILDALLTSDDPLVLLGDPGSGKTMTLQQAASALAGSELRRVFPRVAVFVRLGEFHVEGEVGPEQVFAYALRHAPGRLQPWLDGLSRTGRLVLLFDGMDEMSRERYNEHTEALSVFAGSRRSRVQTLFSCRITDFSPSFIHRRLVLLPFNRSQIETYLRKYLPGPSLTIDGSTWPIAGLARHLSAGDLPVESSNPFVLWLLCLFLQEHKSWPESRVDLVRHYNLRNYERKQEAAGEDGEFFPEPEEAFREWARLAFVVTERNRGAAIPVDTLVQGLADPVAAERVYRMIRVGKSCGVLMESIEGTLYQVRFSHHRFQEYFAALHIVGVNPRVDWLSKFDAPRWQETLVNLVLMGGAEGGVTTLADSIAESVRRCRLVGEQDDKEKPAQRKKPPEEKEIPNGEKSILALLMPSLRKAVHLLVGRGQHSTDLNLLKREKPLPDVEESILADRIELGAKLIRYGERTSLAVQERLKPTLREAVDLLVEQGNPITQVKMMRACQHSTDLDLLKAIEKPLRSPIRWVRDQALILVAVGGPGSRGSGDNLVAEMGFDLATSSFLFRWFTYLKAVLAAKRKGAWWGFALATVFGLLSFIFFFAEAALVYKGFSAAEPGTASFLSQIGIRILIAGLVLSFVSLSDTRYLWATFPLSTLAALVLVLAALGLWHGEWSVVSMMISTFVGCTVLYPVLTIPVALVQLSLLALYLVLTRGARGGGQTGASILLVAWTECGFQEVAKTFLKPLQELRKVDVREWFRTESAKARKVYRPGRVGKSISAILLSAGFVALYIALFAALSWILGWIWDLFMLLQEQLSPLWSLIARALVFGLILPVAYFMVLPLFIRLLRMLRAAFSGGIYFRETFTPEEWNELLQKAGPERQKYLLLRTDHQSLGLQAEKFLEILRDAGKHIKSEPALSVYWDRRDQLEQALRQERQG